MSAEFLKSYATAVSAVNGARDLNTLKTAVATVLSETLAVSRFGFASARIMATGAEPERADINIGVEFCFDGLNAPRSCVCGKAMEAVGDNAIYSASPDPFCVERGFQSVLCAPVFVEGARVGVFLFADSQDVEPSADALKLLDALAVHVGEAVSRIRKSEMDKRRAVDLVTVYHIGRLVTSRLTLKEMVREVVRSLGRVIETDEVNVIQYDAKRMELRFLASFFADESNLQRPEVYPLSDGMNSWIIKNRQPLLIRQGTLDECARLGIRHGGRPARSWLGVPMVYKDDVVGVLSVQSYGKERLYDERSVELLSAVAGQCAVAMENARLYEEALEREEEKERLYFSLTHDLLSLVNPVAGFARLLKELPPDAPKQDVESFTDAITASAGKMTQFVEDILVYAKIKSGKLALNLARADFAKTLESVIRHLSPEISLRRLTLKVNGVEASPSEAAVNGPLEADYDVAQVERVFFNLINNAVKYANTFIEINAGIEGAEAVCGFRNDGDGVTEEQAGRLFDEYYQAGAKSRGVGLGLPTVKRIVELHGGSIRVESGAGKGFHIEFRWPRTLADKRGKMEGRAESL
ncbi:MAG: GAF domain-containing protein [Nitrospinae bacterium]|nr:GAF domain-containing protein [Nitrospinota bacterium]